MTEDPAMSISGTWTVGKTADNTNFTDTGSVGPCSYEDAWAYCGGLGSEDPDNSYMPKGQYHCGIVNNATGAPLIEPDPAIEDFSGYPPQAGQWVQDLSDNSDPHVSFGCNLVAAA